MENESNHKAESKPSKARWSRAKLLDLVQHLCETAQEETQINQPRMLSLRLQFDALHFLWSEQFGKDSVNSRKELAKIASAGANGTTTNAYIQLINSGDDSEWKEKIERQQKKGGVTISCEEATISAIGDGSEQNKAPRAPDSTTPTAI